MANRFPYGPSTQMPGMVPSMIGGAPVPVSQPYHVMPQQYYHHAMPMTTPSMVQVNVPNEMQQSIYQMTVHPASGHGYGQPVAPGYVPQPKGSPMIEEQRRWFEHQQSQIKERLLRERDYQKQQQRLRNFSMGPPGGQKLEADKLIKSMFGAVEERNPQRPSAQSAKPAPPVVSEQSARNASSGFQASQKARDWSTLGDLHDVFSPFSGPNTSDFPAWCQAGAPVPPIYTQVESYVTRNGVIDTSLLYPVLVSSGLSRETLGQIWSLANRHTPGLLDKSELYAALAFVALAQNACQVTSIEILHSLHQAPVPLLNQVAPAPPLAAHPTSDQLEPPVQPVGNSAGADDDDFDDFKSANHVPPLSIIPPVSTLSSSSVGSRLAHHTLTHSPGVAANSEAPRAVSSDDFSDFQQATAAAMMTAVTPSSVLDSATIAADLSSFSIPQTALRGHQRIHNEPEQLQSVPYPEARMADNAIVLDLKNSDQQGAAPVVAYHSQFSAVSFGAQNVISSGVSDLMGAAEDKYSVFRDLATAVDEPHSTTEPPSSFAFADDNEEDDFGDFLSGSAAQSKVIPSIPATPFDPLFSPLSTIASPAVDVGAFYAKQEASSLSDFEFADFQSAAVPTMEKKPASSLSSLISNLHGFQISSSVVPDEEFGDFMAPTSGSPSSSSNSFTSGQKDSKEADQLSNGDKTCSKSTPSFESQSVSSLDFVTVDYPLGLEGELNLGRHGSVPSLDLRGAESPEQEAESGIDFAVGPTTLDSLAKNEISNSRQPFTPMMATGQSLVDRYSLMRNDMPSHTDVHSYEWQRCLDRCQQVIGDAFKIFNGISSSNVSNEVIGSEEGEHYLKDIIEIYRISRRISISAKTCHAADPKISDTINNIEAEWNKLLSFVMSSPIIPGEDSFNFSDAVLDQKEESLKRACGICLLDVDPLSKPRHCDSECFKLTYGGRQYHSACANFWVNFVDSLLPSLAFKQNLL